MGENMSLALTLLLTGMVVVFIVLIVLIVLIRGYSKLVSSFLNKNAVSAKAEHASAPVSAVSAPPVIEKGIPGEVIAAIAAAVSVMDDGSSVSYSIKSIKRSRGFRPVWGMAGVMENTRPF